MSNCCYTFVYLFHIGCIYEQLKAADKDLGQNAELVYSLVKSSSSDNDEVDDDSVSDPESDPFEVDHSSGVIRMKQSVDREVKDQYKFKVYMAGVNLVSFFISHRNYQTYIGNRLRLCR